MINNGARTTRPKRRWKHVKVDCGMAVKIDTTDGDVGLDAEIYQAGDINTWNGSCEIATWPSALVRWR
ncbi:uncharacterized protein AFUA_1G05600 [Aspergillus fumigatus Af293]|uniref:Uncharacterized protein n=2 Tax=Aspergillus fumigatus TaxID=746128 RepID=Q4WJL1_ASPFU|nr:hypothetical protein AFUA_1G05600 [Aspergillus fumigatus Af293]EAL88271.1 hypothetical protein AFUA_1G05600 [Aspergillus fumigatus Af293]EDP55895.1 hypothetical protein AFUB_005950 [Aspergillus fumigatus A1163]